MSKRPAVPHGHLKLCPFCGGKAKFERHPSPFGEDGEGNDRVYVRCTKCPVRIWGGNYWDFYDDGRRISPIVIYTRVMEKWNLRHG